MAHEAEVPTSSISDGDLSISIGDYLKTILRVAGEGTASTGDIARELGVTAPSVTGMLVRMKGLGLVGYQPYKGAELTDVGRREVMRLLRRHRVLETFMIEHLGFGWDEVHVEAERMEHAMSDEFTDRLARYLGQPSFDPHGDPIPAPDGTMAVMATTALADVAAGEDVRMARVLDDSNSELLRYLADLGLVPGADFRVVAVAPFLGPLTIEIDGTSQVIGRNLAEMILVERV